MKSPLLAYFGHHKAATTWMSAIIKNVCAELGWKSSYVSNPKMFNLNLGKFVEEKEIDFLCYTNADFQYVKDLENLRGFHVVRDPRDVIVSGYFSHRYSHPTNRWSELIEHRNKLEKLSKDEGLFLEMEFSRRFLDEMYSWDYSLPNVQEIKMEDLVKKPYTTIIDIFRRLDLVEESTFAERFSELMVMALNRLNQKNNMIMPFRIRTNKMSEERMLKIIYRNDFSRKSRGRTPGEEDVNSHYRKGVAGDWKNHFNKDHIDFFKKNYNDVLIKLGYERDDCWYQD